MATPERAAIRLNIRFKFIPFLLSSHVELYADYKQSLYLQLTYSYTLRSRWLPQTFILCEKFDIFREKIFFLYENDIST